MRAFMNVAAGAGRMVDLSLFGPRAVSRLRAATRPPEPAPEHLPGWALSEMRRHHWTALLEAGGELARHDARDWIQHIDVPTAVVVTERDWAIPANSQLEMAAAIPGASVHRLDDGHLACTTGAFGHTLTHACREVAGRDARGKRKRGRRKRG
jgi:pimeloyl-ACP methyl ester carboxylesterase